MVTTVVALSGCYSFQEQQFIPEAQYKRHGCEQTSGVNCPRVNKLRQCAVLSYQLLLFQLQLHLRRKLGFTRKRPTAKHQMELGNPVEEEEEGL